MSNQFQIGDKVVYIGPDHGSDYHIRYDETAIVVKVYGYTSRIQYKDEIQCTWMNHKLKLINVQPISNRG